MGTRIAIVQGQPDPVGTHFCQALADAYAAGALESCHEGRSIEVARLTFPWLCNKQEFGQVPVVSDIAAAQETLRWCGHLVVIVPLLAGQHAGRAEGVPEADAAARVRPRDRPSVGSRCSPAAVRASS